MKLATKTVLPYIVILIVCSAIFGALMYESHSDQVRNQTIIDARIAADNLAKEISEIYPNATMVTFQEILLKYLELPDSVYVVVFSLDRNVNYPLFKPEYDNGELDDKIFSVKGVQDYTFERSIDFTFEETIYEISVPVIVQKTYYKELTTKENALILSEQKTKKYDFPEFIDQMVYIVKYAVTFKNIVPKTVGRIKISVIIFFVSVMFVLALIYKYQERLLRPIRDLIYATDRLDSNNTVFIREISRNDEIGLMASSIYRMYNKSLTSINNLNLSNEYAQSLIASQTISSLFNTIVFEILRLKGIDKGGMLYWNDSRERFVVKETKNFKGFHKTVANDEAFIKWFLSNRTVLEPDDFVKNFYSFNKKEADCWQESGVELIIPMSQSGKIVGCINLGRMRSNHDYSDDDAKYFKSLAQVAVIAIENLNLRFREAQNLIIKRDLEFARDVQAKLLPSMMPMMKGAEFAISMSPARNIGGDYYDFIFLEEGHIGVCIADVSGKGISAALVMASTRSYLRLIAKDNYESREILNSLNDLLIKDTNKKMFVTMFYSIINFGTKEIYYSNAGHNYPLHYKASEGTSSYLQTNGFPLGIVEDFKYGLAVAKIESGDMLIFYTDGIVEAMNEGKELFGFKRLEDAIDNYGDLGAQAFIDTFYEEFKDFIGDEELNDDYTILAVKIT